MASHWDNNENSWPNEPELAVDSSAAYCIRVVGYLDERWSERLGGLKIISISREGRKAITTLSGSLLDQAALFGVLKALYDMRLPLLSVDFLELD